MIENKRSNKLQEIQNKLNANRELAEKLNKERKDGLAIANELEVKKWKMHESIQRKIEMKEELIANTFSGQQEKLTQLQSRRNWELHSSRSVIKCSALEANMFYPPNCSGYDIVFNQYQNAIYAYGGISCNSNIEEGIKPYFYRYMNNKWEEVITESIYNPIPRYGHSLSSYHKELVLYGGVSQYKQKLKDRCFYTDFSSYNIVKNKWKVIEATGQCVKTRKNHSACTYLKYFIIFGGVDDSEDVVNEINWINLQNKKPRWRKLQADGRFNQKMITISTDSKDYLCIFGGRNSKSEIVNTLFIYPLNIMDGELVIKQYQVINHKMSPREMPIMCDFGQGFLLLGGVDEHNQIVEDHWYYNSEKQVIEELTLDLCYDNLRGAKGCSLRGQSLYILNGHIKKSRAAKISFDK